MGSNSQLVIDSGPVIIKVAGVGDSTPMDFGGQTIVNPSHDPSSVQFLYAGTGTIKMSGGADVAATIVAPNAAVDWRGGGDFYGAMIVKTMAINGDFEMHYDRTLSRRSKGETVGNPVLQQFSWSNY
jgi:hypothetical protein